MKRHEKRLKNMIKDGMDEGIINATRGFVKVYTERCYHLLDESSDDDGSDSGGGSGGGDGGHARLTNGAADDDDAAAGVPALH